MSCGHDQVREGAEPANQKNARGWHGKALITDKIKDKKNTVSINAVSKRPHDMRLDVNAMLGIYVGSFVWNETTMQAMLARERKFISGPASAASMQQLLRISVDPRVLLDIFWDDPLPKAAWDCLTDSSGHPQSCKHKNLPLNITWRERNELHRLIEVDSPKVNTQLSLDQLPDGVVLTPQIFQLSAPEGFQKIDL